MELVVSVFDEPAKPFFQHIKACHTKVSNATFFVHDAGYRSHFTTGSSGLKHIDSLWFTPPIGTTYKIPNIGDEALAYTTYIVQRYYTLPARIAFVHAHTSSWHSHDLCKYLTSASRSHMNMLPFNRYDATNNCQSLSIKSTSWMLRSYLNWEKWFDEMPPAYIHFNCCAQFMTRRELIHRHSLSTWKKIHKAATRYQVSSKNKLPFEYLWPAILDNSKANVSCR